jgi:hypothetical protein
MFSVSTASVTTDILYYIQYVRNLTMKKNSFLFILFLFLTGCIWWVSTPVFTKASILEPGLSITDYDPTNPLHDQRLDDFIRNAQDVNGRRSVVSELPLWRNLIREPDPGYITPKIKMVIDAASGEVLGIATIMENMDYPAGSTSTKIRLLESIRPGKNIGLGLLQDIFENNSPGCIYLEAAGNGVGPGFYDKLNGHYDPELGKYLWRKLPNYKVPRGGSTQGGYIRPGAAIGLGIGAVGTALEVPRAYNACVVKGGVDCAGYGGSVVGGFSGGQIGGTIGMAACGPLCAVGGSVVGGGVGGYGGDQAIRGVVKSTPTIRNNVRNDLRGLGYPGL